MKEIFLSIDVLVQALILAQSKGTFTIEESAKIHEAIEVQRDYYKNLNEQLKQHQEAEDKKNNTKVDAVPETGEQVVDQPVNIANEGDKTPTS